jgi:two-component system, LuxR family, response regulator FixJ
MRPLTFANERHEAALKAATVFVVDDDADVRRSLTLLVRSVELGVESFPCANGFLSSYDPLRPGCLVLDVRMPGMTGLELQNELCLHAVELPIIFVSAYGEIPMVTQALRAGALDFIQKPYSSQTMLERIHEAIERDDRTRRENAHRREIELRLARLSDREREVTRLLADGMSTKAIASHLAISSKTVDNHRAKIFEKIQVENSAELVRLLYSERQPPDAMGEDRGASPPHFASER